MTKQQENLVRSVLLALSTVQNTEQLDSVWSMVDVVCRNSGINPGKKPNSVPQARSLASSLRKRFLNEDI